MQKNTTDAEKLWELIKAIEVAMLTTQEVDGTLVSRPMATQQSEFDGHLWFFTEADSAKVDELAHHKMVNISYSQPDKNRFVSISGKAQTIHDKNKAKELWKPFMRAWFPKGVDDPRVALIRVDVQKAHYWDSPSSKVVELLGFIKAIATGEQYRPEGAQGHVSLKP
jgi:general stress protein 26